MMPVREPAAKTKIQNFSNLVIKKTCPYRKATFFTLYYNTHCIYSTYIIVGKRKSPLAYWKNWKNGIQTDEE